MIISVVSGKGGAGKTTLATAIAETLQAEFYDLDVDAPNAEYFLQPQFDNTQQISQLLPQFNENLCTACGLCSKECRFNALIKILDRIYLTETLCHSCGLCQRICPTGAISYQPAAVGKLRSGFSSRLNERAHIGDLNIGSTRGTYLISEIVKTIDPDKVSVLDGPPGNSCAAVAAIKPADLVVLVVEPSPFGFHDMQQTEEILIKLNKNYLIIANKVLSEQQLTRLFDQREKKPVGHIALDDRYHRANLAGEILSQQFPEIRQMLQRTVAWEVPGR